MPTLIEFGFSASMCIHLSKIRLSFHSLPYAHELTTGLTHISSISRIYVNMFSKNASAFSHFMLFSHVLPSALRTTLSNLNALENISTANQTAILQQLSCLQALIVALTLTSFGWNACKATTLIIPRAFCHKLPIPQAVIAAFRFFKSG